MSRVTVTVVFDQFPPPSASQDLRVKVSRSLQKCDSPGILLSTGGVLKMSLGAKTVPPEAMSLAVEMVGPTISSSLARVGGDSAEIGGVRVVGVGSALVVDLPSLQFPSLDAGAPMMSAKGILMSTDGASVLAAYVDSTAPRMLRRRGTLIGRPMRISMTVRQCDLVVDKAGYLNKQSDKTIWKRRWCVASGQYLFFFRSHTCDTPVGWMDIDKAVIEPRNVQFGAQFAILAEGLEFKFNSEDVTSMESWVDALQQAKYEMVAAAERQDWDAVLSMAATGRDVLVRSRNGRSVLHYLAHHGEVQVLTELMVHNAAEGINVTDNFGMSPLHYACIIVRRAPRAPRSDGGRIGPRPQNSSGTSSSSRRTPRCGWQQRREVVPANCPSSSPASAATPRS